MWAVAQPWSVGAGPWPRPGDGVAAGPHQLAANGPLTPDSRDDKKQNLKHTAQQNYPLYELLAFKILNSAEPQLEVTKLN